MLNSTEMLGTRLSVINKSKEDLCYLAYVDKLTNVYNRNMLEEFREKFNNMEMFVTIVDVDNLKDINQVEGDLCGDHIIRDVAEYLTRLSNWVFRLGGDDFLVLKNTEIFSLEVPYSSFGTFHKTEDISLAQAMKAADNQMILNRNNKRIGDQ